MRRAAPSASPRPRAPCVAIKGAAEVVAVAKDKGAAIKGAAAEIKEAITGWKRCGDPISASSRLMRRCSWRFEAPLCGGLTSAPSILEAGEAAQPAL